MLLTYDVKQLKGISKEIDNAYISSGNTDSNVPNLISSFEAKAIPTWPKTIRDPDAFIAKLFEIARMSPIVAGESYEILTKSMNFMARAGINIDPLKDVINATKTSLSNSAAPPKVVSEIITRDMVVGANYVVSGSSVKPAVDVIKFKTQVANLVSSINRLETLRDVVRNTSEQNFWELLMEMLKEEESFDLIGILSARMLLSPDAKAILDSKLRNVSVLLNKGGKLSVTLMSLGGFLGLATVKNKPELAHALLNIRNPLLGEDPLEFRFLKRAGETKEAIKERKEASEESYKAYRNVMIQMKIHAPYYNNIPQTMKDKISQFVTKWTIGDI